jgi:hypothetical protein
VNNITTHNENAQGFMAYFDPAIDGRPRATEAMRFPIPFLRLNQGDATMFRFSLRFALPCAAVVLACGGSAMAQWGTLKGKFVYDGKPPAAVPLNITKDIEVCGKHNLVDESLVVGKDGGLANVVVYVRTKGVKVNPEYAKAAKASVILDNKNCHFVPHILPMVVTQTLVVKNSDPVGHNTNSSPIGDLAFNPIIPSGTEVNETLKRVQAIPQPVACNIHPWMKAYVLPRDNPYFAVSGPDGSFEIKDLPTGELEFQAWQEKVGYLKAPGWTNGRFKKAIKAGDNDLGTIKLSPSLFSR